MKYKARKVTDYPLVRRLRSAPVLVVMGCFAAGVLAMPLVHADQFDQQIQQLQQQNSQNQGSVNSLQTQADSYQAVIDQLQSQISTLQNQISANQAEQVQLTQQIAAAQAELNKQKQILGSDIKALYVGGQISTVEQLATSKSLSDFVDAQTYRNAVQSKIQDTLAQITKLQGQLKDQQQQIASLLQTQQAQQAQLNSNESQQAQLLAYNQVQQAQYTQQIKTNNSQIASLRAAQAAAERAAFKGSSSATGGAVTYKNLTDQQTCGGGYNFHCSETQDNWLDQWGEFNRECVSYTAWYEGSVLGKYVPAFGYTVYNGGAQGNAYQWHGVIAANPNAADIIYYDEAIANSSALKGDVVYMPIGSLGHVGIVLSDEGNGWLRVGQYNLYDEGMYSEMDLKITSNLEFYHFH